MNKEWEEAQNREARRRLDLVAHPEEIDYVPHPDAEERYLLERIEALRRQFLKDTRPYVERLCMLEMMKPRSITINKDRLNPDLLMAALERTMPKNE